MTWVAAMYAAQGIVGGAAGVKQYRDAKDDARDMRLEGDRMLEEARTESLRITDQTDRFAQNQKMQYLASGVEYQGSAILNVQQTQTWGAEEAGAVLKAGYRAQSVAQRDAKRLVSSGKMAMIQSFMGSASSGANAVSAAKK